MQVKLESESSSIVKTHTESAGACGRFFSHHCLVIETSLVLCPVPVWFAVAA